MFLHLWGNTNTGITHHKFHSSLVIVLCQLMKLEIYFAIARGKFYSIGQEILQNLSNTSPVRLYINSHIIIYLSMKMELFLMSHRPNNTTHSLK